MHGSVTGDGDLDGGGCASPDECCRGMPEICDDMCWLCGLQPGLSGPSRTGGR